MEVTGMPTIDIIEPKYFVLDDDFWILLKEEGKHPYLVIKVNSPTEKQTL